MTDADAPTLRPKRYAIKFNPPRFVLEYTDGVKTRTRSVSLRIPKDPDVPRMARAIIKTFPRRLDFNGVKPTQVERMLVRLLEHETRAAAKARAVANAAEASAASASGAAPPDASPGPAASPGGGVTGGGGFSEDVDLNAVSPEALDAAKAKMDERFNAHRKVLGDEDFVYDVRREFQPSRPCEWDSDSEDGEADDVMALLP